MVDARNCTGGICNLVEVCNEWLQNSTFDGVCQHRFANYDTFALSYICSLAAVPFGRGTKDSPFTNRQKIAQASWVLTVLAVVLGMYRKQALRFSRNGTPFWIALGYVSKVLAIAFASLFGILNGDLNPNSNLLEVAVWILPGLLFHRFSPELIQDNVLVGLVINTITYLPGLITAAFSVWSSGDFALLVPEQFWDEDRFLRSHSSSVAVRVLLTITIVIAILRQLFGSYSALVLASKRQWLRNRDNAAAWDAPVVQSIDESIDGDDQLEADNVDDLRMGEYARLCYDDRGFPKVAVDLDLRALRAHAVLIFAELSTFVPISTFIIMAANFVKQKSYCVGESVPSLFTLQAAACPEDSGITCADKSFSQSRIDSLRFCDTASFNVAIFTGAFGIIVSCLSFSWLFVQAWIVLSNRKSPCCNQDLPPRELKHCFKEHMLRIVGTRLTRGYVAMARRAFYFLSTGP